MEYLAKNKSGWELLEHLIINENDISNYENVTGSFAIIMLQEKYLIGYNTWRKQWEFPAGGIDKGETARQAAERELYEETHQKVSNLVFKGLFKVRTPNNIIKYQAVYCGELNELNDFVREKDDEMEKIMLWDTLEDIGYVDELDLKIAEIVSR